MIKIESRFEIYKTEFKKDTGLDFNAANVELYIAYYNARCSDESTQVLIGLTNKLLNELNFFPGKIRLEIAQMITEHHVIKQLLKQPPLASE